jgi:hypothetical protein
MPQNELYSAPIRVLRARPRPISELGVSSYESGDMQWGVGAWETGRSAAGLRV